MSEIICSTYKHCIMIDTLTPPPGKINWDQTWPGNTQGARISQLALCIPRYIQFSRLPADIFTHIMLENYFGAAL